MSGIGKVVCVTGASGYIASWLVKLLLHHGYSVNATVRDPCDQEKTEHLVALDGAKERLHLFKADLMEEGSFDSATTGCDGVFHTASPVLDSSLIVDPQVQLIDPAVKGTLNVLRSCAKVPSIKRIVITSSISSVFEKGIPLTPDVVIDETWFSDIAHCEKNKRWYPLSKTLAEDAAWKFAKENEMDLVTIHPGFVIGPLLQPTVNATMEHILNQINGTEKVLNQVYPFVDVRDITNAHIQAFEVASASGRYCVSGPVAHILESFKILQHIYPSLTIPDKYEHNEPLKPKFQVSDLKAKSLGISFTPLEVSLRDTIESVKEKGFIASWLVKLLLQHGYTVKASVRNPNDLKKTKHLVELDGAKERLHLFKADLMEEASFDSAINGCHGVFHVASPVFQLSNDPQAEIIEPAVKGTLNVLRSCVKAPSVKKVIITSSMAAVLINGKPLNPNVVVDETWFSDPVLCENMKIWYAASKARAEKAGWEFAKENGIELITIHPGVTLGPLLQPIMNDSVSLIMNLTNGAQTFPNRVYSYHDVRDVAKAHIQAFESRSASGRYLLSGYIAHISDLLKILQQLYPSLTIPQRCENDEPLMEEYQVSDLRAKSLGISQSIPLEMSLRDTVESLKEKGLLSI
ncbi:hypothetical protein G4B88_018456 [Cannabis sativa]|uniref:NAD-dependent epimerase/dehydratase domain-containing protein n=1 Tax=Cannabis sativa TaxID=3483 RepID=A0A7J6HG78_CANSA|nr:hypothetical protein G4B88_018456 [Cannabis sativa]